MALTELKSILSNFRKPMHYDPLVKKGKDKVIPNKTSQEDETLSKTSNLSPKSTSTTDTSKTKFISTVKTKVFGVLDTFTTPKLSTQISKAKNQTSPVKVSVIQGNKNETSNVKITKAENGTDNNTSSVATINVVQDKLLTIMNSNLNVDNIPVKYVVSGKLLQDTSNFNIDYNPPKYIVTPSMLQFGTNGPGEKPGASKLDIDSIPNKYQVSGKLLTDISVLNIDSIPNKYQNIVNLGQFNPDLPGLSNLDVDSIPSKYQNLVNLGQFNPFNPVQSLLDINSIPSKYQVSGVLLTDTSILNVDSIPSKYQNLVNLGQFNPFNATQSQLDINSIPSKYQNLVNLGQFAPFKPLQSQLDINSIPNKYVVSGKLLTDTSTLNIDSIPTQYQNIVALGQFNPDKPSNSILDIDTIPSKYSVLVGNGILDNDNIADSLHQRWSGLVPPAVNFFRPDVLQGAKGFTTYFTDKNNTQFVSVSDNQYGYTDTIQVPLTNTKYPAQGIAGLTSQLGAGSVFNYIKSGAPATKQFSKGYSYVNTYGSIVLDGRTDPKNSPLYLKSTETNSPSALDELYSKYNLQDDSYNPWYIPQPFILRGIQRKGKKGLQRWGGSALADDGLIRAGMAASVERSAFDVARLSQWIASPKGLLWVTKQVGLGFSNPNVETIPLSGISQTKIHSGIASLLSVPTTAFGAHFTTHGLPGVNAAASYEHVHAKIDKLSINRLTTMAKDYYNLTPLGTPLVLPGMMNPRLSSIGGPNSAYGIGFTMIKRVSIPNIHGISNDLSINNAGPGANSIKNYTTLAYGKLKRSNAPFQDFRKDIGDSGDNAPYLGDFTEANYEKNNLEKRGWGTHGQVGINRDDYQAKPQTFRGDAVNNVEFQSKKNLDDKIAKGEYGDNVKDFIAFYFAGPQHHKDGDGDNVMIFRANIQSFTDSFAPEWTPIPIMGRADKAYIYTGFERSVTFTFTAAATSREEMKPMWRKINYLSTYTMPDYNTGGRMVGPFMRLTLGNIFQNTPGFIESLSISIPDEATWEINLENDKDMMQLPTMAEISVTFKVLADYRPQKLGRAYSLSALGKHSQNNNWLAKDSSIKTTIDTNPDETGNISINDSDIKSPNK